MFEYCLLSSPNSGGFKASKLVFDNEVIVIADPSWDGESFTDVDFMESVISNTHLILLSHSTPQYIGGYALLCSKFEALMASIPVYSTVAVSQLGRVASIEFYRGRGFLGPVANATLEVSDIDEYFDRITLIKYSQNVSVLDNRVTLSAFNSGHSLGGSFWFLTKRSERVIYAPGWNQSKDSFLNGAQFLSATTGNAHSSLSRPTAFITGSELGSTLSHKKRVEKILTLVDATLANGGAVLLPVNISGRFLEVLHLIDHHLAAIQGAAFPVYFLSYSGTKVLNHASGLSDWMASNILKDYEGMQNDDKSFMNTSFDPSKVDLLLDPSELTRFPGPKIVFASGMEMENGDLSARALSLLCLDEKTTIILTEKNTGPNKGSLASQLYSEWFNIVSRNNSGFVEDGTPVPLEKTIPATHFLEETPLKGNELLAYRAEVANRRHQKTLSKMKSKRALNLLQADIQSDDEDDEDRDIDDDDMSLDVFIPTNENTGQNHSKSNANGAQISLERDTQGSPSAGTIDTFDSKKMIAEEIVSGTSTLNVLQNSHSALTIDENYITDFILEKIDQNKPVDFRITAKFRPRQAMFPTLSSKRKKIDDYGEVIDIKQFKKEDDQNINSRLIFESKKKFAEGRGKEWGHVDGRREKNSNDRDRSLSDNKLTPQQVLNNEILRRYLDTLDTPVKRSKMSRRSGITIRCGLAFVDFSGYSDARSMNLVIHSLRPSHLIILPDFSYDDRLKPAMNGADIVSKAHMRSNKNIPDVHQVTETSGALSKLTGFFSKNRQKPSISSEMQVNVALPNFPIEVSKNGRSLGSIEFETSLDDDLWSSLNWRSIDEKYKVAHVVGTFDASTKKSDGISKRGLGERSLLFTLRDACASDSLHESSLKPPLNEDGSKMAIGTIRMPELKKNLKRLGFEAEFKGEGTLVVEETIAIRKLDTSDGGGSAADLGDIIIDGQVGPTYYKVRNCVRSMLAFVQ